MASPFFQKISMKFDAIRRFISLLSKWHFLDHNSFVKKDLTWKVTTDEVLIRAIRVMDINMENDREHLKQLTPFESWSNSWFSIGHSFFKTPALKNVISSWQDKINSSFIFYIVGHQFRIFNRRRETNTMTWIMS